MCVSGQFLSVRFFGMKTEHESTTQKHMKNIPYMKNTMWKVKNEDEIDESHRSQLQFEYDVHLLNYTIKIKNIKT